MSIPAELDKVVRRFASAPKDLRVKALLQYGGRVPPLPEKYAEDRSALEQVHECQTPFFLITEVDDDGRVHLFFDAPPESPTVRGFAGILYSGLEGQPAADVLGVPPDFYGPMGLEDVVSTLRMRGMSAILARLQRQVREATGEA
jgi:cysteine desulfuration protein SufE